MSDHDEFDRQRMLQEEDTYFAVKDSPPKAFKDVATAVMGKAVAAKSRKSRKPKEPTK